MGAMASQITSLTIVYSTVYSSVDQRKHQSPTSLVCVQGIDRSPVNSLHKWPVTRHMFPFDDVIMNFILFLPLWLILNNMALHMDEVMVISKSAFYFPDNHQQIISQASCLVNTLRPRQNGTHLADNIFKCIFLNENVWIWIKISLKFVPKGPIDNMQALVQIMAGCQTSDKPLSEPMLTLFADRYMYLLS